MHWTGRARTPYRLLEAAGAVGCTALLLSIATVGSALAQTTNWTGNIDTDWTKAGNWSGGVPGSSTQTVIDTTTSNPTVLGFNNIAATGSARLLWVGQTATGQLTIQSGSTLTVGGSGSFVVVGQSSGSNGTLNVTSGSGLTSAGFVRLGEFVGATGVATVTGSGSIWTANTGNNDFSIGYQGEGTLTIQDKGTVTVADNTIVANQAGSTGILNVTSGGTLTTGGGGFIGGQLGAGSGLGSVTVTGENSLWTVGADLFVGSAGTGTLTVEDNGRVTIGNGLAIGWDSGSKGTVNITGGTVTAGTGPTTLANLAGTSGTLNITGGGTLETQQLQGGNGTAQVNVDGGTLRAMVDNPNFIIGFSGTELNIAAGGLTIDTADFNVATDATSALSGKGALTKTGSGTLVFNANNTFSGGLNVAEGTVQAGIAGTAFGTGLLTVQSGATADLAGFDTTVGGLAGAGDVSLFAGTLTLDQNISTVFSGAISGTGGLTKLEAGTLVLTGTNTYSGGTTISAGTLQLGDGGTTGSVVGAVANSGTLVFNRSNEYDFVGTISGGGDVIQASTGTTVFNTAQGYTGATTIDAGTLRVNSTLASAVTVNAAGTLGGTGTINNDVTNSGTVAPGVAGVPGGTLTINGNYSGNAGKLAIESALAGNDSTTDQLIITGAGHTASGTTGIVVTNQGGPGALTTGNGIPIILPTGGATIDAGAFGANGSVVPGAAAGPYQYLLFQGTGGDTGYYLRSHADGPGPGPTPIYRPDVSIHSVLAGMARSQELATLGTFHERDGDQRLAGSAGNRTGAWGRLFGQTMEQSHSGHVNAHLDGNMGGLQSGLDVMQWVSPSGHQDRFGLFAAYARTTGDVSGHALGVPNRIAGRAELDGTSFGGYWTHLAPTGWYTDTVLMGTRFNGDGHSVVGSDLDVKGYGVTASVEGGYPIPIAPGVRLEPQGQLVYSHVNIDDVHDPSSYVAYDTPDALFGRLGLRLSADMLPLPMVLRPYLKANVWQDFTETDTIRFANVHEIESRHRATTLELGGGVVWQLSANAGLWFDAGYTTDIGGSDDQRESVRGMAGLRVTW